MSLTKKKEVENPSFDTFLHTASYFSLDSLNVTQKFLDISIQWKP